MANPRHLLPMLAGEDDVPVAGLELQASCLENLFGELQRGNDHDVALPHVEEEDVVEALHEVDEEVVVEVVTEEVWELEVLPAEV